MLIVPIVVFTLLMGARRLSPSNLGKIGGQVVVLYALTSAAAVGFGLLVANLIDPGPTSNWAMRKRRPPRRPISSR